MHLWHQAGNVLLTADGQIKLADFGVSTATDGTGMQHTIIGTPHWMAPEVITGGGHDWRADVWSVGITAIELAQGDPPHAELQVNVGRGQPAAAVTVVTSDEQLTCYAWYTWYTWYTCYTCYVVRLATPDWGRILSRQCSASSMARRLNLTNPRRTARGWRNSCL